MTLALARFAAAEPHGDLTLEVAVGREGAALRARWDLRGDLRAVCVPAPAGSPRRRDDLWRDTCFELFLAEPGATAYREVNLAPSGDWNVYVFAGYRRGGAPDPAVTTLPARVVAASDHLAVETRLAVGDGPWDVAVAAVLRDPAGALSHWALRHGGPRPDFHRRASFVLRV